MRIQNFTPNESVFEISNKSSIETTSKSNSDFGQLLKDALNSVNDKQIYADKLTNELVLGGDVEVHEVMLAAEEASLSLQMAIQIRNKITEAVKELTNLQI